MSGWRSGSSLQEVDFTFRLPQGCISGADSGSLCARFGGIALSAGLMPGGHLKGFLKGLSGDFVRLGGTHSRGAESGERGFSGRERGLP